MTGRDLRAFVNLHRNAIGASDPSLVSRLIEGKSSGRYKKPDYEKLKAIAILKEASGLQSLQKIKHIQQENKDKKEHRILEQHRIFWHKELNRLNNLYKSKLYELELAENGLPWEQLTSRDFFEEVKDCESFIENDFATFTQNTIKPVWDLREDIQTWLEENRERVKQGEVDGAQVSEVLDSVKSQQRSIMRQLRKEQTEIEQDTEVNDVFAFIAQEDDQENIATAGLPDEARVLTCPYEDLRMSVLNQFDLLDNRYQTHWNLLNVKYQTTIQNKYGGWTEEDHIHFDLIINQYPCDIPNRRSLYIDRLMRELTKFSRHEIVEHEEWLFSFTSYQHQKLTIHSTWQKDRVDLLLKVKATFIDAWEIFEKEKQKQADREHQEEICRKLHQKVEHFQQQRQEVLRLNLEIAEQVYEQQQENLELEKQKERRRREIIQNKVKDYKEKKMLETRKKLAEEQQRLRELQEEMKEQTRRDAERVAFREQELKKRQEARKNEEERRIDEEHERQLKLQILRDRVCVNVPHDPLRFLQSTEASRGHLKNKEDDEELELQKPLFAINTFNSKQVVQDPRHRVEEALRIAGLNNTDYAREILATVKPLRPTRPDQSSSLFKHE